MGGHYLDLRAFTRISADDTARVAGVALVESDGASLGVSDVASVTGLPVLATFPRRASTARAVDAGVILSRTPEQCASAARDLLARFDLVDECYDEIGARLAFGRCDSCGAACTATGCSVDANHASAVTL